MARLSLHQLNVFCHVANNGNLGQSAEQLHLSRGAVSQALKTLEQQLGVTLFERSVQGLALNSHGHQLRPKAEAILAQEQELLQLFHPSGALAGLRLGASRSIGTYLLPGLLAQWAEPQLPSITLANSHQLQQQLLNYQLDIALIESERIDPRLIRHHWRRDEMVLIGPPAHPLADRQVSWAQLEGQRWVLREADSGSREQFDHHIQPFLQQASIVLELSDLEAVARAVEAGLGLSLLSRLVCAAPLAQHTLSELRLPQPLYRRFSVVYRPESAALPQLQQLLQRLQIVD
ncbi:LysR substrate-binding domain-containing protein [Ferrimonas pelagia]|uniref:LysR substrate-binding domain-containing protein n=1 Tax=Ferrimonas pelagia TaxID=1177826 RepID=A0ABP9ESG9_9GAMM